MTANGGPISVTSNGTVTGADNAVIDGFTITNGGSYAISCEWSSPKITRNIITSESATHAQPHDLNTLILCR